MFGRKDTEDGPLCVITPEESGWYRAYVNNILLDDGEYYIPHVAVQVVGMI